MRVRLTHWKKYEKNFAHLRGQIGATQLHTHHPTRIVVYVDSSLLDKYVVYEDKKKHC